MSKLTGGFCKYGNFVWVNEGEQERCINLALIEAATLSHFESLDDTWGVHVMTNASGWNFTFATEAEARNFLAIVVRDESGVPFRSASSADVAAKEQP